MEQSWSYKFIDHKNEYGQLAGGDGEMEQEKLQRQKDLILSVKH
jgi:hypothetical protein